MVQGMESGARLPRVLFWFCHLIAACPCARAVPGPGFLMCIMETLVVPTLRVVSRTELRELADPESRLLFQDPNINPVM